MVTVTVMVKVTVLVVLMGVNVDSESNVMVMGGEDDHTTPGFSSDVEVSLCVLWVLSKPIQQKLVTVRSCQSTL